MKKILLTFVFIISFVINCFSQDNYNGENGNIIKTSAVSGSKIIIRKHIQKLQIGNLANNKSLILFRDFNSLNEIGKLQIDDNISITKAVTIYNKNGKLLSSRLFIQKTDSSGWIDILNTDPYNNSRWSIVSIVNSSNKKWTIRKIDQQIQIEKEIIVYNEPSITSKILFTLINPYKDKYLIVRAISATEEYDIIDGRQNRWVCINYSNNKNGWVFGGLCPVNRDGPLIWTPEDIIYYCLGNP
jgi:hypothetical protein